MKVSLPTSAVQGLSENKVQFGLLVLVNAFVGGMVGLERSVLPLFAGEIIGTSAHASILSFIVVFGIAKAVSNYAAGQWAHRIGRKKLLIAGWVIALPIPLLLFGAGSWWTVLAANALLGIQQGLTWSTTVVMKIDLVGKKHRGLAMGLNEFAGYLAVAVAAYLSAALSLSFGFREVLLYGGYSLVAAGLLVSLFLVRDTGHFVAMESTQSEVPRSASIFLDTTWRHPKLGAVTQAGLVNNLNDGMTWGLLPIILLSRGFGLAEIGIVAAVYPAVWGIGQVFTGKLADHWPHRTLIVSGMLIQGAALLGFAVSHSLPSFIALAALLGIGTAMVYPTFLAAIAEHTHPEDRSRSMGVFRLWRDLGYALGALLTGWLADTAGWPVAVVAVAVITISSAVIAAVRMRRSAPAIPADEEILSRECISQQDIGRLVARRSTPVLIDVRSPEEYSHGHISGARNIPLADLESGRFSIGKARMIVTICAKGHGRSEKAASLLRNLGYASMWLCGGTQGWNTGVD